MPRHEINYGRSTLHPKGTDRTTETINWKSNLTVIGNLDDHLDKYLKLERHRSSSRVQSAEAIKAAITWQYRKLYKLKNDEQAAKNILFNANAKLSIEDEQLRNQAIQKILESNNGGCEVVGAQSIAKHGWSKGHHSYLHVLYQKTLYEWGLEKKLASRLAIKNAELLLKQRELDAKDQRIEELEEQLKQAQEEPEALRKELALRPSEEEVDAIKKELAETKERLAATQKSKSETHNLTQKVAGDVDSYRVAFRRMIDIMKVLCKALSIKLTGMKLDAKNPVGAANKLSEAVAKAGYTSEKGNAFEPLKLDGRDDWAEFTSGAGAYDRLLSSSTGGSKRRQGGKKRSRNKSGTLPHAGTEKLRRRNAGSRLESAPTSNPTTVLNFGNLTNIRDQGRSAFGAAKDRLTSSFGGASPKQEQQDLIQFSDNSGTP